MSTAETRYTFRNRVPVTLERARTQDTSMSAYVNGSLVSIVSGTYTLLGPGGAAVIDAQACTISGGVASYAVDGTTDIPATVELGTGWQERWVLTMPDSTVRTVRRTAALARFELHPPVTDDDILRVYPDLLDSLGNYAADLQGWIDDGWDHVVRTLWKNGNFPHILVEPSDVFAWAREEALSRIFRALFKSAAGADERWQSLWDYHRDQARNEAQGARIVVDRDQDGIEDDGGRKQAAAFDAHWNVPHTGNPRSLSRKFR